MKQLTLIGFWADYELLFFASAAKQDSRIKVINLARSPWRPGKLQRAVSKLTRSNLYTRKLINTLKKNEHLIFQDNKHCLSIIAELKDSFNVGIMCRDPMDTRPAIKSKILDLKENHNINVWSFDPGDCERHSLFAYHQFISPIVENNHQSTQYDLLFIGRDKGRKSLLMQIAADMQPLGYKVEIDIKGSQKNSGDKPLSYVEYLNRLLSAKCIIDITQEKQQGLTLRPLESLVYGRKLLSNNPLIATTDFYHPDNIFLFDKQINPQELSDFLDKPTVSIGQKITEKYLTQNVLIAMLERFS